MSSSSSNIPSNVNKPATHMGQAQEIAGNRMQQRVTIGGQVFTVRYQKGMEQGKLKQQVAKLGKVFEQSDKNLQSLGVDQSSGNVQAKFSGDKNYINYGTKLDGKLQNLSKERQKIVDKQGNTTDQKELDSLKQQLDKIDGKIKDVREQRSTVNHVVTVSSQAGVGATSSSSSTSQQSPATTTKMQQIGLELIRGEPKYQLRKPGSTQNVEGTIHKIKESEMLSKFEMEVDYNGQKHVVSFDPNKMHLAKLRDKLEANGIPTTKTTFFTRKEKFMTLEEIFRTPEFEKYVEEQIKGQVEILKELVHEYTTKTVEIEWKGQPASFTFDPTRLDFRELRGELQKLDIPFTIGVQVGPNQVLEERFISLEEIYNSAELQDYAYDNQKSPVSVLQELIDKCTTGELPSLRLSCSNEGFNTVEVKKDELSVYTLMAPKNTRAVLYKIAEVVPKQQPPSKPLQERVGQAPSNYPAHLRMSVDQNVDEDEDVEDKKDTYVPIPFHAQQLHSQPAKSSSPQIPDNLGRIIFALAPKDDNLNNALRRIISNCKQKTSQAIRQAFDDEIALIKVAKVDDNNYDPTQLIAELERRRDLLNG